MGGQNICSLTCADVIVLVSRSVLLDATGLIAQWEGLNIYDKVVHLADIGQVVYAATILISKATRLARSSRELVREVVKKPICRDSIDGHTNGYLNLSFDGSLGKLSNLNKKNLYLLSFI